MKVNKDKIIIGGHSMGLFAQNTTPIHVITENINQTLLSISDKDIYFPVDKKEVIQRFGPEPFIISNTKGNMPKFYDSNIIIKRDKPYNKHKIGKSKIGKGKRC
jgi:hypothetical protein